MPWAPCPRGCWSAPSDSANSAPRAPASQERIAAGGGSALCRGLLDVLGLEEAQESRVLGEKLFDLGDARSGPVPEPGIREGVLDPMQAAFAHAAMIDIDEGRRHGPFGSPC